MDGLGLQFLSPHEFACTTSLNVPNVMTNDELVSYDFLTHLSYTSSLHQCLVLSQDPTKDSTLDLQEANARLRERIARMVQWSCIDLHEK